MPAPIVTALLVFAAILTCVSPVGAAIVALLAVILEIVLAVIAGFDAR